MMPRVPSPVTKPKSEILPNPAVGWSVMTAARVKLRRASFTAPGPKTFVLARTACWARDGVTEGLGEHVGPVRAVDDGRVAFGVRKCAGPEYAAALSIGGQLHNAGADAARLTSSLIIGEPEQSIAKGRASRGISELIAPQSGLGGIEEVARVQRIIAQEFKASAVKTVGAGFGHDVHDGATEFAILGIERICDQAELGYRVEIRNDCRPQVAPFTDITVVNQECVRGFALAIDRADAGRETSRDGPVLLDRSGWPWRDA